MKTDQIIETAKLLSLFAGLTAAVAMTIVAIVQGIPGDGLLHNL